MLVLKTLSLELMHGFGMARRIEQVSRGVFKINPGSEEFRIGSRGFKNLAQPHHSGDTFLFLQARGGPYDFQTPSKFPGFPQT